MKNKTVIIIIFIAFAILIPWLMYQMFETEIIYRRDGTEVLATVIDAEKAGLSYKSGYNITVEYIDENRHTVVADANINMMNVFLREHRIGREFIGYVLPGEPYVVQELCSTGELIVMTFILGGIALVVWVALILLVYLKIRDIQVSKQGRVAIAKVVDRKVEVEDGMTFTTLTITFTAYNNREYTYQIGTDTRIGASGKCFVKYFLNKDESDVSHLILVKSNMI